MALSKMTPTTATFNCRFFAGNLSVAAKWHGVFATAFMMAQFILSPI
jgi:hypothetical protein